MIKQISSMLELCSTKDTRFPPQILYSEGWMLRLIINCFSINNIQDHPLSFPEDGTWYSEALLPSTFLARFRGDKFSESYTHADGAIGHFEIGDAGKSDLALIPNTSHLVILEAKMFSKLSSGVKNASYYNQAARNVACIAEVLNRGQINPSKLSYLGFFVIAPRSQIEKGIFTKYVSRPSIQKTVERRANEYDDSKEDWLKNWFYPTIQHINIGVISWEELISTISTKDQTAGNDLKVFYELCLKYNSK